MRQTTQQCELIEFEAFLLNSDILLLRCDTFYAICRKLSSSKFLVIVYIVYWIEIVLKIYVSVVPPCSWESESKILILFVDAMKGFLVSIFLISHSRILKCCESLPNLKIFTKQSTTESNVNLSLPRNFSPKDPTDWDNFVAHARESIEKNAAREKDENFHSIEPRSLSINSDPDPTKSRISTISSISQFSRDSSFNGGVQRRDTIRNVMYRVKHDNLSRTDSGPVSTPVKCPVIPVPKNIPNEILDNVQLFDYYYNNLSSLNSLNSSASQLSDNSNNNVQNTADEPSNSDNRATTHRLSLSRIFTKPSKSNNRLSRMSAFDESTSDESSVAKTNEIN